ncbi:MAG: fused MFS/spermidine synthase [Francisellaceae bacterium]|jgi:predicted membrane-bound spermidine synthase|nr:fused MFS/spermidine synthase [Francisellaceae bacterium]MBT6207612.1 fused MFS/spermidine synthase [Francisellaceae bacterium]MBT6538106.1 fused MFS/spermidine synthase [Francisellaceae bacterium]
MHVPSLWIIILVEGFVTLSTEILTIRQLMPFVGNSVIVTSIIIGLFLLFLAYGYLVGGKHKDNLYTKLHRNFIISALIISIGLSYPFIDIFFQIMSKINIHLLVALVIYLLIITSPLVFLLGQTVPITVNLIKSNNSKGEISGKVLHINTIGSFLGSTLTTIVLMNYLGVAWTVAISAGLLIALALFSSKTIKPRISILNSIALTAIFASYYLNIHIEDSLFVKTNSYGNYQVIKNAKLYNTKGHLLIANNSAASFVAEYSNNGFPYIEFIKKTITKHLKMKNHDILVLGAGAFSLTNSGNLNNKVTYVDIDKDLLNISRNYLGATLNHKFIADDARAYLNRTSTKYDAIVLDTYQSTLIIPSHLVTKEYYKTVRAHLKNGGTAILNIIADPLLKDPFSQKIDNTIRSVFAHCMSHPLSYHNIPTNIIYVCFNHNSETNEVYTDNKNTALIDNVALLD